MKIQGSAGSVQPSATYGKYQPPAEGEVLRRGHGGPSVAELQALLNAAGAKPPLEEDGKFGPLTQAALQKATGSAVFDDAARAALGSKPAAPPDDFRPPATTPPGQPAQPPRVDDVPPVNTTPPPGGVAAAVVERARAEDDSINPMKRGDDGNYKGWKHLQEVFEKTTGWRPTDAQCKEILPGRGALPGGKSWCGIWACHILQEAGVNVRWDLTKGGMTGDVTHTLAPRFTSPAAYKAERSAFEQSIRPGDVITVSGNSNHHAIVTAVNPDGTVETMDGNKPHVGPGRQKLSNITSFYRPNGG